MNNGMRRVRAALNKSRALRLIVAAAVALPLSAWIISGPERRLRALEAEVRLLYSAPCDTRLRLLPLGNAPGHRLEIGCRGCATVSAWRVLANLRGQTPLTRPLVEFGVRAGYAADGITVTRLLRLRGRCP